MPGIPLVTRETSSYSRSTIDQMCREDARGGGVLHLTEEEEIAAEESLSIYCKPVELYNILQRRSIGNPSFLQRCLLYKIQAKNKRRIQMTISMLVTLNGVVQSHNIFPLYVLLARLVSNIGVLEYSAVYRFSQPCVLTGFAGVEGSAQVQANFVLPEMNKLASEVKSGSLHVLLVSFAGAQSSMHGIDLTKGHLENVGGCCLLGKIPLDSLCNFWEKSPNLGLGQRAEVTSPVDMNACFLKLNCLTEDNCVLIQIPFNSETVVCSALKGLLVGQNQIHLSHLLLDVYLLTEVSHFYCLCFPKNTSQLQVNISAEEVGAKEKSSYTCSDMSSSSSSHVIRLRAGNVIFNYRYYNNKLQKTEVTEDFSCPFCLVKCASFKITQEFQAVNISVKTDIWRSKTVADGIDPKQQTFFCSKKPKRKRPKNLIPNAKNAHDKTLSRQRGAGELLDKIGGGKDLPTTSMCGTEYGEHNLSRFYVSGVSGSAAQAYPDAECVQMVPGNNLAPPAMLQFAKTRKLSIERSDMRNRMLLHKRQFFHSHRAQSMEIEQVMSDRDSEDEVDDDVADFEDRRMLDDFVDVTKDEKQMMHLWNSFVRKQRVLADGHIPWACEAFTRLHGHDLFLAPALMWCWRLFMIKLWNHGLLDARTMNLCNMILEQYQKQDLDPMKN
ncbi:polycomb group protein EMBRYONIC FLOWER 2 isoform X4 [Populus trichocarpa]|uniref:polycomb group protein EMBRYONIC FLOWER 2 isoform X4 n=1 Tax=Populus trichocarpa TaxID=3694 RepID=UPI000D18A720|nr:polycomb group protein EMBRYONIC FLOWER 2 isoform X4 [Populus trichocarpa]|eukprot:XP_024449725.1 polycomb group protein EMBRYONIC FLOWER 2 isoform X4 [Populus trichocarpa]